MQKTRIVTITISATNNYREYLISARVLCEDPLTLWEINAVSVTPEKCLKEIRKISKRPKEFPARGVWLLSPNFSERPLNEILNEK